jgi:hypothetical protein
VQSNRPLTKGASSAALLLWALIALFVGALVYALDRDPSQVWLMPAAWSLPQWRGWLPRAITDSLPSLVHVFAFSVLTALVLAKNRRQAAWVVCAWLLLDVAFEVAQIKAVHAFIVSHPWLKHWPVGDFDLFDLLALLLGAVAAWVTVQHSVWFSRGEQ